MARNMCVHTVQAAQELIPTLGWYLSVNQMKRLANLLREDNPNCEAAGHDVYRVIHYILDKYETAE